MSDQKQVTFRRAVGRSLIPTLTFLEKKELQENLDEVIDRSKGSRKNGINTVTKTHSPEEAYKAGQNHAEEMQKGFWATVCNAAGQCLRHLVGSSRTRKRKQQKRLKSQTRRM